MFERCLFCAAQVPCTSASLNTGDVFILDAGLKLYLWNGPDANMYEKSKGALAMQRIKVRDCSCARLLVDGPSWLRLVLV